MCLLINFTGNPLIVMLFLHIWNSSKSSNSAEQKCMECDSMLAEFICTWDKPVASSLGPQSTTMRDAAFMSCGNIGDASFFLHKFISPPHGLDSTNFLWFTNFKSINGKSIMKWWMYVQCHKKTTIFLMVYKEYIYWMFWCGWAYLTVTTVRNKLLDFSSVVATATSVWSQNIDEHALTCQSTICRQVWKSSSTKWYLQLWCLQAMSGVFDWFRFMFTARC